MSLENLGYFTPGHCETICHVDGRDHLLARTALRHEEAHENLTSWSTSGLYSAQLSEIDRDVGAGIPPDPLTCLAMVVDSSRETHEGFAAFTQLMHIGFHFGMKAAHEAFDRLPLYYRQCATRFFVLYYEIASEDRFFFQPPSIVAVRSFALVALNTDIFRRVGSFHGLFKAELATYLADRSNNPDTRFKAVLTSVLNGEVNELMTTIRAMLRRAINKAESLQSDLPEQKVQAARFSQRLNTAVLKYYGRRLSVDLTILNPNGIHSAINTFVRSAAAHYEFDPTRLLARRWLPNDPIRKVRFKAHRVEFSDAELLWDQPIENMDTLEAFLRTHYGRVVVTVSTLDSQGSAWMIEAAARIVPAEFKTGVLTCRSASTNLSQILGFLRYYDTALVVMEGLVHNDEWKSCLLSETYRLYVFATMVSVEHVEELAVWLGDSCSALILTEAFGHHALLIINRHDRAQRIIAVVAEDIVARFTQYLDPKFACQTRDADPVLDAEPMLAAWVYTYGPFARFLRPR